MSMKLLKKTLAALLCLAMLLTMVPAVAAETVTGGDVQFNDVCTVFSGSQNSLFRGGKIGITAGDNTNVGFAFFKCFLELIHEYPPLCSGRWRRNPCHHGRKR